MVNKGSALDAAFAALSDPSRRRIVMQLKRGETRVSDLAAPFAMSLPAVSKHLKVLERAGLIARRRVGREHRIRLEARGLDAARRWLEELAQHWDAQFDALERYLEDEDPKTNEE